MRKQIIVRSSSEPEADLPDRLDLPRLARVELTSEDPNFPIENALEPGSSSGWRAAAPGKQTIRLVFDKPQDIRRAQLVFLEAERPRTQEFVLRWLPEGSPSYRDIVRQQYTFSPPGANRELEDYTMDLDQARALELVVIPDISGGDACASLQELRLA